MAISYPNLPGIEVSVQDGGLILPDTGTTESLLVIAPCQKADAPVDPFLARNSTDATTNFGDYTDANGVINPLTTAWKVAFEGGNRRTYLLPLTGITVKEQFLSLHDALFGRLADFSVDNIVLKDVFADIETPALLGSDFTNPEDIASFPAVAGVMKYGYKVASKTALTLPVTIAGTATAQIETATVGTTNITTAGNFDVKVTGAGIAGSPLTISVAVTTSDITATLVATKVRTALTSNGPVSALYTISGAGANVILTRTVAAANDATLNVELFASTSTAVGSVNVPTSVHTLAGAITNGQFIINNSVDRIVNLTGKTYDGTNGKTLDDLATDIQTALVAADASLINFKVVAENGTIVVLGDIAYTAKPGSANDVSAVLKLVVSPAVTNVAVRSRHDKGMIYVGNFAELLRDYCEDQTINHNTVKGFIGASAPSSASLTDIKANVDRLVALVNEYSGHVSIISSPELGYTVPGKNGYYYCNGVVTYAALVSTLTPQSAPTNKPIAGVGTLNYSLSLRQLNQLSGNKYVSFRLKNGAIYVTDGITTAPDLIIGGIVQASDYTRLSTLRITHAAINLVRQVSDPFVGEPNGMAQSNALTAAIKSGLEKMKAAGAIQDYRFSVIPDRGAGVLGQSKVTLQLIPAFETRKIVVDVSLATQLN